VSHSISNSCKKWSGISHAIKLSEFSKTTNKLNQHNDQLFKQSHLRRKQILNIQNLLYYDLNTAKLQLKKINIRDNIGEE